MLRILTLFVLHVFFYQFACADTNLKEDSFYVEYAQHSPTGGTLKFQPYSRYLLISSDISIPIEYRDSEAFHLAAPQSWSWGQPENLQTRKVRIGDSGSWTGLNILAGDFNGDGRQDLLARSNLSGAKAFVIYGDAGPRPTRVAYLATSELAGNITIEDLDGDGKDEIGVLANDGVVKEVLDIGQSGSSLIVTHNLDIDYRQLTVGKYIGYAPRPGNVVSTNRLKYNINPLNGLLSLSLPIRLPQENISFLDLALYSNSSSSMGVFGSGWSSTFHREISPCIGYGSSVRTYCLNGRDLVLTGEENNSSALSGVYKIYKYKSSSIDEITTFKYDRDGHVFYEYRGDGTQVVYGSVNTGASRGEYYKIKEIKDAKSNQNVVFSYTAKGLLDNVSYGSGNNKIIVKFEYSNKNSFSQFRVADSKPFEENVKLVTKISIGKGNDVLGNYYLRYEMKGSPRISDVQYCATISDSSRCEKPYVISSGSTPFITDEILDNTYVSEAQFVHGALYTKNDTWDQGVTGNVYLKYSEKLQEESYRVVERNLSSADTITYDVGDFNHATGSGDGKYQAINPIYVNSKVEATYAALTGKVTGTGCFSIDGNVGCNLSTKAGIALTSREDADFSLSSKFEEFTYLGSFEDAVLPIDVDLNKDGLSEVIGISAFYYYNNYHLGVDVLSNQADKGTSVRAFHFDPDGNGRGRSREFPGVWISSYDDIEIDATAVLDLDGDGNLEILVRYDAKNGSPEYRLKKYYHIEFDQITRQPVISILENESDLFFDQSIWMDVNGDGLSDLVRASPEGLQVMTLSHGQHLDNKYKLHFFSSSNLSDIKTQWYRKNDADFSNVVPFDSNLDGLQDLIVLNQDGSRANIYISGGDDFYLDGELSDKFNIKSKNIDGIKISDFDRDGRTEIVEWLPSGHVRLIELSNMVGKIISAKFGNDEILSAKYDDFHGDLTLPMLPPLNRQDLLENKVSELVVNEGVLGSLKKEYLYENVKFSDVWNFSSFTKSTVTDYRLGREGNVRLSENIYEDKSYDSDRNVVVTDISVTNYKIDSEISGQNYNYKAYSATPYVREIIEGNRNKRYIDYKIREKFYSGSYVGNDPNNPVREVYTLVDNLGRLYESTITNSDYIKYYKPEYESLSYPAFVTSTTERVIRQRAGLNYRENCDDEELITKCVEVDHSYTLWRPSGSSHEVPLIHTDTSGALGKKITNSYLTDSFRYLSSQEIEDINTGEKRKTIYRLYKNGHPTEIQHEALQKYDSYQYTPFGLVSQSDLATGKVTSIEYDLFGRSTKITDNVEGITDIAYQACSSSLCPDGAYMRVLSSSDGQADVTTYLDIHGEAIGSARQTVNGYAYTFSKFDEKGRVKSVFSDVSSLLSTTSTNYQYQTDGEVKRISVIAGSSEQGITTKTETYSYEAYTIPEPLKDKLDTLESLIKITKTESFVPHSASGVNVSGLSRSWVSLVGVGSKKIYAEDLNVGGNKVSGRFYNYNGNGDTTDITIYGDHAPSIAGAAMVDNKYIYQQEYDIAGNIITSSRPGRGDIKYQYNAFGEQTKVTTADGHAIESGYDALGRMKYRVFKNSSDITEKAYVWNYDAQRSGLIDSIEQVLDSTVPADLSEATSKAVLENFTYKPSLPLVNKHTKKIDGNQFGLTYSYDNYGRVSGELYDSGYGYTYLYQNGQRSKVTDTTGKVIWELMDTDRRDRPTQKRYLNGKFIYDQEFEDHTNHMIYRELRKANGNVTLDGESLYYDPFGDLRIKAGLLEQQETVNNDALTMSYTNKGQLESVTDSSDSPIQGRNFSYDDFGNFNYKDVSLNTYQYKNYSGNYNGWINSYSRPDGISDSPTYSGQVNYPLTGNTSVIAGYSIQYNSLGQPTTVSKAGTSIDFNYGPADELQSIDYGDRKVIRWNGVEKIIEGDSSYYRYRRNAAITLRGDKTGYYMAHVDHLGSIRSVWDENGNSYGKQTFDAYGRKVHSQDADKLLEITDSGYTGHLMIDGTPFIHMNARLYDAGAGIFTSVDPVFADMYRTGGLNAYGYVYGNPFSFVDPTGMNGIRGKDAAIAGLGVAGNSFGLYAGYLITVGVPYVGWVVGPVIIAKSGYGLGTNSYELGNATVAELAFDGAEQYRIPDTHSSLFRLTATQTNILGSNLSTESKIAIADGAELLTDFAIGKLPAPKGGSGSLYTETSYPFSHTNAVIEMKTPMINFGDEFARNNANISQLANQTLILQGFQYGTQNQDVANDFGRQLAEDALRSISVSY
ncbi:FG-GAP-like repeat-containing protein [Bacterioplanoides sp.]|uniref:FG-GAP-like repeat-containing protein n=1 Tax=Bacterioplanoides sp. TaxID=2066072 RepID=UPI003AFFE811